MFRRMFWITLILAVPTIALNGMFSHLLGYTLPELPLIEWVSPALGIIIYFWGGWPFLSGGWAEIKARKPGMMLLISLGITAAFLSSLGSTLGLLGHDLDFWWELALLVLIMLLGHWIEMRALAQTSSALDSLSALLPDTAIRLDEHGAQHEVPLSSLKPGDTVLIRPGATVPSDGTVIAGSASVDESMLTGESKPVIRSAGDQVVAGTVATDSALTVTITATGEHTALAGIQRLVAEAQSSTSRAQRIADKAAGWLFWFALGSAMITATVWFLIGQPESSLVRTITVLVIACPHALGLAIPLVVTLATERAAKAGILVKDRLALEQMRNIDAVLFDKTGTLTKGQHGVSEIRSYSSFSVNEALQLAASAEAPSEHPIGRALTAEAAQRNLELLAITGFSSSPSEGVSAKVQGKQIRVGGPRMLETLNLSEPQDLDAWKRSGGTIIHIVQDTALVASVLLEDEIRPESFQTVAALHRLGKKVVLITGDAQEVAEHTAEKLGIDQVFSQVRPEDKAEKVQELQRQGLLVAMVGDGVNDAPALAQADVGIAIGAGTDVAIASAGVILASSDPRAVISTIELSRASYRKMTQNLWWAAGYNLLSVPLAAGVLAGIGFILPMSVGAVLMSLSTVVVALNAQLLRRLNLNPESVTARVLGSSPVPHTHSAPTAEQGA